MSIVLKIESVDRTSVIDWRSLRKQENLTSQVDLLTFRIHKYGTQTYKPEILDEVELFDGATKIFAGNIVNVEEKVEASRKEIITCTCKDYTHIMDRKLVISSYENETINDIIEDIKDTYLPAGFTDANVDADINVKYIAFNYEQPSKCFEQLASLIGYDWYVDYDKDIHFFGREDKTAPFGLTDINDKYFFNSLILKKQSENLRNTIYVRGGKFFGNTFTEKHIADGEQTTFFQAYRYQNILVKKNGSGLTVGIDNIDDPSTKDILYNFQEKAIKFRTDNKPAVDDIIEVSGNPQLPVIIKARDFGSITDWGVYEHKIIDKSLNQEGAKERAKAEIIDWGDITKDSVFETKESGLRAGQLINVQSTIRGINKNFTISRINTYLKTPTELRYRVNIMASRSFGMNEFLQKLLREKDKEIEIEPNEILNKVEATEETITTQETHAEAVATDLNDSVTTSDAHPYYKFTPPYKWGCA